MNHANSLAASTTLRTANLL